MRWLLLPLVLILLSPARARADWQFAPFFGYAFKGETSLVTPEALGDLHVRWSIGGTVTRIGRGPFGFEGIVLLVPHFFEAGDGGAGFGSRTHSLMGKGGLAGPQPGGEDGGRPVIF